MNGTQRTRASTDTAYSVADHGFGGVEIDIFCAGAHASIKKAASIVGIGRSRVIEVLGDAKSEGYEEGRDLVGFDLEMLEKKLGEARKAGRGVIVCPAYGEVNTVSFLHPLFSPPTYGRTISHMLRPSFVCPLFD